jgi:hypothetical protein
MKGIVYRQKTIAGKRRNLADCAGYVKRGNDEITRKATNSNNNNNNNIY